MEYYKIQLNRKMWNAFLRLENNPTIFNSYYDYFMTLSNWVKDNAQRIGDEIIEKNSLSTLINIDSEDLKKYIIDNPEISFKHEPERMFGDREKPKHTDTLIMWISNTLWDLVRQYSGIDCPQCMDGDLQYLIAEVIATKERKLILECEYCYWTQNSDGTEYTDGIAKFYPTYEAEILNYKNKNSNEGQT